MGAKLLEIQDLKTYFDTRKGVVRAVDGVSLDIDQGQTVGVVGESGCGKSVTALSVLRLAAGRIAQGSILFEGRDIVRMDEEELLKIRGNDISMIFQEPMTSLNPVYRVGDQIAEAVCIHRDIGKKDAMRIAADMLEQVQVPDPGRRLYDFPHQLSGGMRQRAMIAMALCCNPKLLIADEPTTALDVTIQAQIIELMMALKARRKMSIMLITHNLGVVADMAEKVIVMYAGVVVEEAPVAAVFKDPRHPYTKGLLAAVPRLDAAREKLHVIKGTVPNPLDMPAGCRFNPRCPHCEQRCREEEPPLFDLGNGHKAKCWLCGEA